MTERWGNLNVNNIGRAGQERMLRNGWQLKCREGYNEYPEEMFERLSKRYEQVRIFWTGTMIPGIHDYYAFVKERRFDHEAL